MRIKNASTHARNFKAHGLDISIPAGESIRVPPGSEADVRNELAELHAFNRNGTDEEPFFVLEDDVPEPVPTPREPSKESDQ